MKLMVGVILLFLAGYDLKYKAVPVIPVIVMGGGLLAFRLFEGVGTGALLGGCLPGAVITILAVASREKIGMGDGLVLLAMGCGFAVEELLVVMGIAFLAAAMVSLVLLLIKKATRKTELPFVPFLFLGYLIAAVTG